MFLTLNSGRRGGLSFLWILLFILLALLFMGPRQAVACEPVEPVGLPEMEPNDDPMMAQPLPPMETAWGQLFEWDTDCFLIDPPPPDALLEIQLRPDFFNPVLRLWGYSGPDLVFLGETDEGEFCQPENTTVQWDPCRDLVVDGPVVVEVAHSAQSPPTNGSYQLSTSFQPSGGVPQGDCCSFPLPTVSSFPWSDTLSTTSPFRDQGLNAARDIWIPVQLDEAGTLVSQTCLSPTNFDTFLWLLDADCETVLDSDDNSCVASNGSRMTTTSLEAGLYYVVLEGAGSADGAARLDLLFTAACPPVSPQPGSAFEVEPNGMPETAVDWWITDPMHGSSDHGEDSDWFHLLGWQPGELALLLQPDTFDPVLRLWGMGPSGLLLLGESNQAGVCEGENTGYVIDPCLQIEAIDDYYVQVEQAGPASLQQGSYNMAAVQIPSSVPVGDCCEDPILVSSLPYSDTRSSTSYRDQGFGAAKDVWYKVQVSGRGVLRAKTCGPNTNFDTVLRLTAADGSTVLASNDNSTVCGVGSTRSWLTCCLDAGTCFVVVEGAGNASGTFDLDLAFVSGGSNASLVIGPWGERAEFWHNSFSASTSTAWLLANDPCNRIQEVGFFASPDGIGWIPLGSDSDGQASRMATEASGTQGEFGWWLDFDPMLLPVPPSGAEIHFEARALCDDGEVLVVPATTWYTPALDPELVDDGLPRELELEEEEILLSLTTPWPGEIVSIDWKLGLKELEWQRSVPHEYQRGISDTHCSPTAAAACLEWLDATYGTNVTGGWSGEDLITLLGIYCNTNVGGAGTSHSDLRSGLQDWIDDNGGGYTVHHGDEGVAGMQDQGESQGQDVIATLEWEGGGAHSVTLSSIHNLPAPDGTLLLDFMDPWTGDTQYGWFDPRTGQFDSYGDDNDSGSLGTSYYVCPTENAPGDGSGSGGGSGQILPPFIDPIPVPLGHWFLKLSLLSQSGHVLDRFHILHRPAAGVADLRIEYLASEESLRLGWEPVPGAASYEVYTSPEFTHGASGWSLWQSTGDTQLDIALSALAGRQFFRVRALAP